MLLRKILVPKVSIYHTKTAVLRKILVFPKTFTYFLFISTVFDIYKNIKSKKRVKKGGRGREEEKYIKVFPFTKKKS